MFIDEGCAKIFKEVMEKHGASAIRIFTVESDCGHGRAVNIEITNDTSLRQVVVNGVNIAATEEDEALLSDIRFEARDGRIYIETACECGEECDGGCDCEHDCCHHHG